jgi:hypothetical protein
MFIKLDTAHVPVCTRVSRVLEVTLYCVVLFLIHTDTHSHSHTHINTMAGTARGRCVSRLPPVSFYVRRSGVLETSRGFRKSEGWPRDLCFATHTLSSPGTRVSGREGP